LGWGSLSALESQLVLRWASVSVSQSESEWQSELVLESASES
jgi:hypothetical protein